MACKLVGQSGSIEAPGALAVQSQQQWQTELGVALPVSAVRGTLDPHKAGICTACTPQG